MARKSKSIDTLTPQERWYQRVKEDPEYQKRRRESRKSWAEKNPEKDLMQGVRERAKKKSLLVDMTHEDIVIPKLCPILNVPLIKYTPYAPSVDRIDPNEGYIKGNIWVISRKANSMKQNASKEELENFAKWVLKQ